MASKYREDIQQGVESLTHCTICTDRYSTPKILPCQHTFCLPCLEKFYETYNASRIIRTSNFPCPQCRKTVYLSGGGLSDLPTDFKIGQIQDVFEKINITIEGKGINCDVCRYEFKRSKSECYCTQCGKYLCSSCSQNHADNALFSSHTTLSIGSQSVDSLICSDHKEEIKYYCTHCKIALCTVCALSKHSKHETLDISQAMDQQRKTVQELADKLKENLAQYEVKAEALVAARKDQEKNCAKLKENVKKHVREFITKVKDDESKICSELDKALKIISREVDKEIETINAAAKNMKGLCDSADSYLATGQSLDLINRYDQTVTKLQRHAKPPSMTIPQSITKTIKFVPDSIPHIGEVGYELSRDEESSKDGSLQKKGLSKKTKPSEKLSNSTGVDVALPPAKTSVTRQTQSGKSSPQSSVTGQRENTGSSGYGKNHSTSSSVGRVSPLRTSTPTRMSPLRASTPTNSPCTGTPPTSPREKQGATCVYQKKANPDEPKLKWKTMDKADAKDVAFMADGTIVVTEYKDKSDKLQIFDPHGNIEKCVAWSSQNLIRPWGCAINHHNGYIIVTDHGDRAVKVLDADLSIKQVWRSLFVQPAGVAVMRTGEIVITDIGSKSCLCSIHSSSGIRKRDFSTKGTSNGQLLQPNYLAVDHQDRILISDAEQNCVKIFNPQGKELLKFSDGSDKKKLTPFGICVDAQNNILVADHTYGGVSLFSSDGRFIQNIAKISDQPWGIAIHDNGSLAVATDPSLLMYHIPMFQS